MKVLQSILVVLGVLTVFGSARGDRNVQCTVLTKAGGEIVAGYEQFVDMLLACVVPNSEPSLSEQLDTANTTEEYRDVLKGYCDKVSIYDQCIVDKEELATRCLSDPIQVQKIKVQIRFLQHILSLSCEQDGARLVSIIMESERQPASSKTHKFVKTCLASAVKNLDLKSATVSTFSLQQYQIMKTFKTCVFDAVKGHDVRFEDSIAFLNQATDTMYCIDELSGTNISCKSVAAIQCELHGVLNIGEPSEPFEVLSTDTALCYLEGKDSSSIRIEFKEANSTDDFQKIAKKICDVKPIAKSCIAKTKLVGELCLLGKNLDIFRGMMNLLEVTHRISCVDEGVRLSNILAEIKKSSPEHRQSIDTCFDSVERGLKSEEAEDTDFKLIQYHVMKRFANCIAEFGRDHNQAFVDAAAFLGEGVEMLTCPDEENGGFVLCNTLPDNL